MQRAGTRTLGVISLLFLALTYATGVSRGQENLLKRELLIEDVRQLADIIESSHPDPYSHGGGRIAFHRQLHEVLRSIPQDGMTRDEFIKLLRPFVATIGDQHTSIYTTYETDNAAPGGLPFVFEPIEKSLYVLVPFSPSDNEYIGSRLVSVEGVPLDSLVQRFSRVEGVENEYFALREFGRGNLLFRPYLQELLPEWSDFTSITFELQRPSGAIEEITRRLPVPLAGLSLPKSRIDLPSTDDSGFLCDFLNVPGYAHEIAYLRVDHMQGYREAKEMAVAVGAENPTDELARIPSATDSFRSFVIEMKRRGTQALVIDMRNNGGGNYMMAPILVYFLYGKDVLTAIPKQIARSGGGSGTRYSRLYFDSHPKVTLASINEGRDVPLVLGDIDFSRIFEDAGENAGNSAFAENPDRLKTYRQASTFYAEYETGTYSGYYRPRHVLVLMTPQTSSSGLDMALFLYRAGAKLVGTPSAQSPNSWGNLLEWQLTNSKIKGEVSSSFDIAFGDDPEKGRVLPVHFPLTWEKLASYDFDHNACFLFAIDILKDLDDER
jgi:Peptidase family S41